MINDGRLILHSEFFHIDIFRIVSTTANGVIIARMNDAFRAFGTVHAIWPPAAKQTRYFGRALGTLTFDGVDDKIFSFCDY